MQSKVLSRKAFCQSGKSGIKFLVNDVAAQPAPNQINSGMNGVKGCILFLRGTESASAFLPKDVLSSQLPSSISPAVQMITSITLMSPANCLIISGIFIDIIFS